MCSHSTFNKPWMDFLTYVVTAFHKEVDVVLHMLSLLSLKEQWMLFSMCNKQWIDFNMLSLLFHQAADVIFHILSLPSFKNQWMQFSLCCQGTFSKQWMWFFTSCHWSFLKNNECCFPCIVTSHLRGSGWISICYHCCFKAVDVYFHMLSLPSLKKQWTWFSICFHCTFNKQRMVFHVVTVVN